MQSATITNHTHYNWPYPYPGLTTPNVLTTAPVAAFLLFFNPSSSYRKSTYCKP